MKRIMKSWLSQNKIIILLFFVQYFCLAQNCIVEPEPIFVKQGGPQNLSTIYESKNGWCLPAAGEVRILFVFFEVNYTAGVDPTPIGGNPGWLAHQLPTWANNITDVNAPTGVSTKLLTRYFQLASSGNYTVLGDYLLAPDNGGIFKVNSSNGNVTPADAIASINTKLGTSVVTGSGLNSISYFDKWTAGYAYQGALKSNPSTESPGMYDHVMFICRNSNGNNGIGYATFGLPNNMLGFQANTCSYFGAHNTLPFDIIRHEYSHLIYGSNNFHCGGGGDGENYWIPLMGGWSNMSLYNGSLNSWNAWDRLRLDWKAAGSLNGVNARNSMNTANVNGDLDATNSTQAGTYTLRDFTLTGDAIRIKLPFIDANTEYQQWIWIENHQGKNANGVEFDRWQVEDACVDPVIPGLYAYMQIDKEVRSSTNQSELYGGYADYLRPLTGDGFWDRAYETNTVFNNCIQWGNTNAFTKTVANSLTGGSDQEAYAVDKGNNGQLNYNTSSDDKFLNFSELKNSNYSHNTYFLGNSRHAFTFSGNKKIGIGTNPSSANMMNMVSFDYPNPTFGIKNTRKIYLNGVSIEILSQNGNTIQVKISFSDVDIMADTRLCADEIVLNPIASPSGYSMNIKNGKTVTLDQGTTATRMDNPQTINAKSVFASATQFKAKSGAYIHAESNSNFIVDNKSVISLQSGSKLELEAGSKLIIRNNSQLTLESGSNLIVKGNAQVIVETGGKILYNGGSIKLNDNTSTIDIKDGFLELGANQVFTYTGSSAMVYGYIKFTSPYFPSNNIIAHAGSSINITGFTKNKTIFEVTQESMILPLNLASFKIKNGSVLLGPLARVFFADANTVVDINNSRFTSNTGAKTNHRGLVLYGQSYVTINTSSFENGTYGVYGWLTYNGAPQTFNYCSFVNNDIGLFSHDKGITLNYCSFYKNSQYGWYGEAMSFNSFANSCAFGGSIANANATALYFQGAYNISLKVDNPAISYNTNGIIVSGTTAYVRCGYVTNHIGNGLEVIGYGTLDMGDNWDNQPSKVIATNNGTTIKCTTAYNLDLNNGLNALYPSVQGVQKVINGTMAQGCFPFTLNADNNQWKSGGGSPIGTDYLLQTHDPDISPCPLKTVTVSDLAPITASLCGGGGSSLIALNESSSNYIEDESNLNLDAFNEDLAEMNNNRTISNYAEALNKINAILSGSLNDDQRTIAENWQCIIQTELNQSSSSTANVETPVNTGVNCNGNSARLLYSNQPHIVEDNTNRKTKGIHDAQATSFDNKNLSVKILPNPNNGNFELNLKSDKECLYELTVFDIAGKVAFKERFRVTIGNNVKLFSEDLEKGIYIASVKNNYGESINIKLIIE